METSHRPGTRPGRKTFSKRKTFSSRGGAKRYGAYNGPHKRRSAGRKMQTFDPSRFINTQPVQEAQETYTPVHTFATFGIHQRLVAIVEGAGITIPTPIQDQIIPEIMKGNDVIGLAETGTGKTAAFLVPLIEKSMLEPDRHTLILTPTRELALQIQEELRTLSRGLPVFSATCVGGANIRHQINAVRRPNHFVIGTPGRILDLIQRKVLNTQNVTTLVFDEADRMLDMGFINDIKTITAATPKERQTLFFSATFDQKTKQLTNDFLKKPVVVSVKKQDVTKSVVQDVVIYPHNAKFDILVELLKDATASRVIVFGAMKHSVQKLATQLSENGIRAESIHGNKTHSKRQQALRRFKGGEVQVLVATDVAARGIHVDDVSHVINYDLPVTFEDYVHRIGRTGRGSKKGMALTFVPKN